MRVSRDEAGREGVVHRCGVSGPFLAAVPLIALCIRPLGLGSNAATRRTHRRWMAALTPLGTTVRSLAVALRSKAAGCKRRHAGRQGGFEIGLGVAHSCDTWGMTESINYLCLPMLEYPGVHVVYRRKLISIRDVVTTCDGFNAEGWSASCHALFRMAFPAHLSE